MENKRLVERLSLSFFLVFIGTLLLLSNFGFIRFIDLFNAFLSYWPVLVILAGFKIILNALPFGKVLGLVLDVLVYLVLAFLLISFKEETNRWYFKPVINQSSNDYEYTLRPEEPIENIDYSFNVGATRLNITDDSQDSVVDIKGKYIGDKPVVKLTLPGVADEPSAFDFSYIPNGYVMGFSFNTSNFDVNLSEKIANSNLEIKLGAGDSSIELDKMKLSKFTSTIGAGNLEARFKSEVSTPNSIDLKVGAGNMSVFIPKEVKVTIKYSVGAGMITLHEDLETLEFGGLAKAGSYSNDGVYNDIVNITASVGAGNIDIYHE